MATRTYYLDPKNTLIVYPKTGELNIEDYRDGVKITVVPEGSPPPSGGNLVFESTFEDGDYELWEQNRGFWNNGNTFTHPKGINPDGMGEKSLRSKQDNETTAGGNFPPGEEDFANRIISLPEGNYYAKLWRVGHDTGVYRFGVYDKNYSTLGEWVGTEGLNEAEWLSTFHSFTVPVDDEVTLEFYYRAPDVITFDSGVKCALLQVYKV